MQRIGMILPIPLKKLAELWEKLNSPNRLSATMVTSVAVVYESASVTRIVGPSRPPFCETNSENSSIMLRNSVPSAAATMRAP